MTVAALRLLLDEIDEQGGPEAARHNRLRISDDPPLERSSPPMTITAAADLSVPPFEAQPVPVGQLLKWGDEHPDPDVRDQAARARIALTGLRRRHAADQELAAITDEAEQLEQRLAALRAREAELAPPKPKKSRKPAEYPAAEVRAWAAAHGVDCPPVGRVPKGVVDAWRAATQPKESATP